MIAMFFDIDGTLIKINGSGRRVMKEALTIVFGAPGPIDQHNFAGKTDTAIVYDLMDAAGIDRTIVDARFGEFLEMMEQQGSELFFEDGLEPCPGVPELLRTLSRKEDVLMGLLTGNSIKTASLKLEAAGLAPDQFKFGAYGSDAWTRREVAEIAWNRAEQVSSTALDKSRSFVIGDTPADIDCGRHVGAKTIAVATGNFTRAELAGCSPDLLLDDLSNMESILQSLNKHEGN